MKPTVPERLSALGQLFESRAPIYGDDYKRHGHIMAAYFPNGITLKTPDDFNRYAIFQNLVTKNNRYANVFHKGGHIDSLDDISVYAQMLQELDGEKR